MHEGVPFAKCRLADSRRVFALQPVGRRQQTLRILRTCRLNHGRIGIGDRGHEMRRPPAEFGASLDRHGREFRRGELHENVGAGRLHPGKIRIEVGIRDLVGNLDRDRNLAAETLLQALQIFRAHDVILIEDGNLAARMVFQQVLRIDVGFVHIGRQEAHAPWRLARLIHVLRARQGKKPRHLFRIQVGLGRRVGGGADGAHREQNLVLLDQLAGHIQGFFWIVAVVINDHVDLAAIDPALGIDLVEIGRNDLGLDGIGGGRTGYRRSRADADLVGTHRRALRESRRGHCGKNECHRNATPRCDEKSAMAATSLRFRLGRRFRQWRHRPALIDQSPHLPAPRVMCSRCLAHRDG